MIGRDRTVFSVFQESIRGVPVWVIGVSVIVLISLVFLIPVSSLNPPSGEVHVIGADGSSVAEDGSWSVSERLDVEHKSGLESTSGGIVWSRDGSGEAWSSDRSFDAERGVYFARTVQESGGLRHEDVVWSNESYTVFRVNRSALDPEENASSVVESIANPYRGTSSTVVVSVEGDAESASAVIVDLDSGLPSSLDEDTTAGYGSYILVPYVVDGEVASTGVFFRASGSVSDGPGWEYSADYTYRLNQAHQFDEVYGERTVPLGVRWLSEEYVVEGEFERTSGVRQSEMPVWVEEGLAVAVSES